MRYITLVLITIFAMRFTATFQDETDEKQCSQRIGDVGFSSHTIPIEAGVVGAADFNNDGQADLVNGGEPELTIMLGDGEGMFEVFSRVPGGEEPSDFALVDLNEDGSVDIVIANHDTNYLTILLGSGDGTFQPAKHSPLEISVSPHPHVVSAADLDMDGHADLLVDHRDGEGVLILRGLGDGSVQLPGILAVGDGDPYLGMAIGDVNEDGKLDIVTPNPSEVAVLVNTSEGQIAFSPPSLVAADTPFGVELGDFN